MSAAANIQVAFRKAESLAPYVLNSRTHGDIQLGHLEAAILAFGWTNPVLADADGLVAGHARTMVALRIYARGERIALPNGDLIPAGCVPVIDCTGWDEAKRRAYIIADNKVAADAGWDFDILRFEFDAIEQLGGSEALVLTGFDPGEFDAMFAGNAPPAPANPRSPDDTPTAPTVATSRPGDVWLLGKHRVICGDSTKSETISALLIGAEADVCLTDPPYGIGFAYAEHDDRSNEANARLVEAVFALAPKALVWTPGLMNLSRDATRFGQAKVLCWHKGFAAAGNGLGGASTWEPVLVVAPKHKKLANDYLAFKTDREELDGISLREHHPCPKPVALFAHLAEAFCPPDGIVYEPFSGSGTTLLAAEISGRRCYAVEISPAYVDVAVARWENFTGRVATLASSGLTFREVQEARALDPEA